MRLVHLSDLHLGYRQYQRLTPAGVNQREADVAATFRAAIDQVIALAPDVVVVAGDVFHAVRPPNQAILHAFLQFTRLRQSLPDATIVVVAGNHDSPRSSESGGILQLFAQLGLHVVDREARRLAFPDKDLSILAVPDVPGLVRPSLVPDPTTRFNVLLMHYPVQGAVPTRPWAAERDEVAVTRDELGAATWDYVALGDYHVYTEVAPNAFYSGSIDYTSLDIWGELRAQAAAGITGKGFIERDLVSGAQTFHVLPRNRDFVEFPFIHAAGMTAAELDEKIRTFVDRCRGGIDDKVIRVVARDVPREVGRELDHKAIREYKRRALNFQLDLQRPEAFRTSVSGSPGGGRPLELKEIVVEKLRGRPLDANVDREALIARAIAYIDEAQAAAVAPAALIEV